MNGSSLNGFMARLGVPLMAIVAAAFATSGAASAQTLYFTAIPDEDETKLEERFGQVADYFRDELDVEVRYVPMKSYAASVTAFRNGQVQLAWFGGLSGIRARQATPGSEPIAQGAEDREFYSYFIANRNTGIEPSEDGLPEAVRGKRFTFGSKSSTSGRLIPEYHVRQQLGGAPDEVFDRVGFSGNHSRTIDLVESGAYEVGALNFTVWDEQVENGEVDTDDVQVIWQTPTYSNYQWTIRGDVDERFGEGFKDRVQQVLLDMDDPELLALFPRSKFVPAEESDYDPIRETARELGLID